MDIDVTAACSSNCGSRRRAPIRILLCASVSKSHKLQRVKKNGSLDRGHTLQWQMWLMFPFLSTRVSCSGFRILHWQHSHHWGPWHWWEEFQSFCTVQPAIGHKPTISYDSKCKKQILLKKKIRDDVKCKIKDPCDTTDEYINRKAVRVFVEPKWSFPWTSRAQYQVCSSFVFLADGICPTVAESSGLIKTP